MSREKRRKLDLQATLKELLAAWETESDDEDGFPAEIIWPAAMSTKSTNATRPLRICIDDAEPQTDKAASQTPDNEVEVNQQETEATPELGDDEIIRRMSPHFSQPDIKDMRCLAVLLNKRIKFRVLKGGKAALVINLRTYLENMSIRPFKFANMDKGDFFPLVKEGPKLMKPKMLKALRRDYILREPVLNMLKEYGPPGSYYAVHQLFEAAASGSANTD